MRPSTLACARAIYEEPPEADRGPAVRERHVEQPLTLNRDAPVDCPEEAVRTVRVGLAMSDQRPLMRALVRTAVGTCRIRANRHPCTLAWKLLGFGVLVQREREGPPVSTSSSSASTRFGARRSNFDADRSIASETRADRLGRSCSLTFPLRVALRGWMRRKQAYVPQKL